MSYLALESNGTGLALCADTSGPCWVTRTAVGLDFVRRFLERGEGGVVGALFLLVCAQFPKVGVEGHALDLVLLQVGCIKGLQWHAVVAHSVPSVFAAM